MPTKRRAYSLIALLIAIFGTGLLLATAASPPLIYVDTDGIAISGYDVVTYFEGRQPGKGDPQWFAEFRGAKFRFVSRENRDRFVAEPERYVPQFGGFCAFAMSEGKMVKCDPRRFSVRDGQLYLFSSGEMRESWLKNESPLLEKAVTYWRSLLAR